MPSKQVLLKTIADLEPVLTGHGIGEKRVLLFQMEYSSPITQIAQTYLKSGDIVEGHCHPTMDEHFVFQRGKCEVTVEGEKLHCEGGQYLLIPAGFQHQIEIITDTVMLTVGVALD